MCYSAKCFFEDWNGECCQFNKNDKIKEKLGYGVCLIGGYCEEPDDVALFESIDKEELKVMRDEIKRGNFK